MAVGNLAAHPAQAAAPMNASRSTPKSLEGTGTLFPPSPELQAAIDEIYRYLPRDSTKDTLNRQIRSGIGNELLAQLVVDLRADDHLCLVQYETEQQEPQIICSLGLFEAGM